MLPYLYQSASLTIGSYGVMLAIAYLTGRYVFLNNLGKTIKEPINSEFLIIALLFVGVIGAKLMFVLKNPDLASFTSYHSLTAASGFSSQGAILAAMILLIAYSKFTQIALHSLLDSAAPAAILAYAIARIGCFLSGDDCWGLDSDLPWAMGFPNGIKPTDVGQTVHPLPLYEVIYSLMIWRYLSTKKSLLEKPYQVFFSLLVLWGSCRFMLEFISTNPIKLLGMTGSQAGALLMLIIGLIFLNKDYLLIKQKKAE